MKHSIMVIILFFGFITLNCGGNNNTDEKSDLTQEEELTQDGRYRYDCYSARNCGGKVISHRDPHNCKTKSRGKSIYDNVADTCTNL